MPTTLITTLQGIGLGIMAQDLVANVPEVTKILGVRRTKDAPSIAFDPRVEIREVGGSDFSFVYSEAFDSNDKVLAIESSYGAGALFKDKHRIYVPMWEQGSVTTECAYASEVISITRHTETWLRTRIGVKSRILPWPVRVPHVFRGVPYIKRILHNAGSLGGNHRKGTLEAIQIFQQSGVAKVGIELAIHAWAPPTVQIEEAIACAPQGIRYDMAFPECIDDIYEGADLLLMPSKIEGHALVALEAMARGIPTLVTKDPPISEYEEDSDYLLSGAYRAMSPLAAPYTIVDVEEGAHKLRKLCERNLHEKSLQVRDLVKKTYSWEVLGPAWRDLCR